MISADGQKRAIRQYHSKLPAALKERYGGSGTFGYTEAQVHTTVEELKLNSKYVEYAVLIFCGEEALKTRGISKEHLLKMSKYLGQVGSGGDAVASEMGSAGSFCGGFDDGGAGDGGGGGD